MADDRTFGQKFLEGLTNAGLAAGQGLTAAGGNEVPYYTSYLENQAKKTALVQQQNQFALEAKKAANEYWNKNAHLGLRPLTAQDIPQEVAKGGDQAFQDFMQKNTVPGPDGKPLYKDPNLENNNVVIGTNEDGSPIYSSVKQFRADEAKKNDQSKLEQQYRTGLEKVFSNRSGELGVQNSNVNTAIKLRTLADQYYDPVTDTYNVPPAQHADLAIGYASMLSKTGIVSDSRMEEIRQKTAKEGLAKTLIYLGADPKDVGGPTQSVVKNFIEGIDRQGIESEKLRDRAMSGLKDLVPTGLKKETVDRLNKAQLTSSYNDYLKTSPGVNKGKKPSVDLKGLF